MTSKLLTPPSALAVSMDDARLALRVDGNELDVLITAWIRGITDHAEHLMGRSIMQQTWQVSHGALQGVVDLPYLIDLPHVPLISVTSVKYANDAGELQTLQSTEYVVDSSDLDAYITPKTGWPSTKVLTVEYVCGYGNIDTATPPAIKSYILAKLVEQFDASNKTDKASVQSSFLDSLLDRYRVWA